MRKYIICLALLSVVFMQAVAANKPWTFLVYMAAANDLNPYAAYDLQEMMNVGSSPYVNIIVYLTIQEDGQPKQTKKLYITKNSMQQIGPDLERDSGDVNTLVEALQWACTDYPSDQLAVVLWDHGSGPLNRTAFMSKGVCYDFDTGNYLTDLDCLQAFSWVKNQRGGKNIDIVACDACLLASLELAYTFSSCVHYFVASEETIPGNGFQYTYVLSTLATKTLDPLSFAKLMVSAYNKEYIGTQDYTLSATDLNAIFPLVKNVNAVADILSYQLKGKNATTVKSTLKKCIDPLVCPSFDDGIYLDLYQLYKNLLKNVNNFKLSTTAVAQFKTLLTNGVILFSKVIIANVVSTTYRQMPGGLSLYFAQRSIDSSYYNLYWTKNNPQWLNLLTMYNATT